MMSLTIVVQVSVSLACHYFLCHRSSVSTVCEGCKYIDEIGTVQDEIVANGDCLLYLGVWNQQGDGHEIGRELILKCFEKGVCRLPSNARDGMMGHLSKNRLG